jgi:two-component system, NarL family, response regulator DevR
LLGGAPPLEALGLQGQPGSWLEWAVWPFIESRFAVNVRLDMESDARLRVMVVDDHEVVREGIRALLDSTPTFNVVGEAGSVREAIESAAETNPDVVVMDVRLADGSGIEATREIRARRPQTQVLMLTTYADDEALFAALMAGAAGYVLKQVRGGELVRSIRAVAAGENLLNSAVTKSVLDRLRRGKRLLEDERLARLSAHEERILILISEGRTNRQIGYEMKLAEKTVKNYVSSILSKLEVARRAEAAAYLVRHTGAGA